MEKLKKNLLYRRISSYLERFPEFYRTVMLLKHRNSSHVRRLVTCEHDLMIEGYPRSSNSFACRAFMQDNGWRDIRLATHIHSPAHVLLGVKYKVPVMVLIREPFEAVSSLVAFQFSGEPEAYAQTSDDVIHALIESCISRYITFYKRLMPVRDKVLIATFEEVTTDYGKVVRRLNEKFGTNFALFEHNRENTRKVFANSGEHLSPNPGRSMLKRDIAKKMKESIHSGGLAKSQWIYAAFLSEGDIPSKLSHTTPRSDVV